VAGGADAVTVTIKEDTTKLDALVHRLKAAAGKTVRVGILADAPKDAPEGEAPSSLSLIEVAMVHEFGAPAANIPQRSFIRATVDERRADIDAMLAKQAQRIVAGAVDASVALDQVGLKIVGWVQQAIKKGIAPALAPRTVARKKSSKPLIDTGQLRSAIKHEVVG
jgi:hypothetical protein